MACCKAEEYGNWCADLETVTYEGQEYCIFHAPAECAEKQDVEAFNRKVFQRIDKAKEAEKECDLSGTIFPGDISFKQYDKDNPLPAVRAVQTIFVGKAIFSKVAFIGDAEFMHAEFRRDSDFSEASFTKEAYFNDTSFNNIASFVNSSFNHAAAFSDIVFEGLAFFYGASFTNGATFSGTHFGFAALFIYTTFEKSVFFNGSVFPNEADFSGAFFQKKAISMRPNWVQLNSLTVILENPASSEM